MNIRLLSTALVLIPGVAFAHTGDPQHLGLGAGISHPLTGIDHLAAMVAVGILGASIGGRAIWALPISFVSMMIVGALLGLAGLPLLGVETAIVLSSVAFGTMIILNTRPALLTAMVIVGMFAVFHGHAHGAEMPTGGVAWVYIAGFVAATMALHLLGAMSAVATRHQGDMFKRAAGFAIAGVGVLAGAGYI